MKKERLSVRKLFLMGVVLTLVALLSFACQPAPTEAPPAPAPAPAEPTDVPPPPEPTPLPDQSEYLVAWESGPHADNYDLGKGPNTYCSRCHSPQNWDPDSTTDLPPNCVTCKFPTDDEVRMATTMDFVEEADWAGIGCAQCHQVDENGIASEEIAWLNPITKEYVELSTPNELCQMCHLTTKGVKSTGGRGVEHEITLGGSAHANWAGAMPQEHRPSYCVDCHDAHSAEPKQCVECHEEVTTSETHMNGLNATMLDKVDCQACHDASGMDVGPHPDEAMEGKFVTVVSEMSRSGEMATSYVKSHSVQWQVSCDRCHFAENVWELPVFDADGNPPEAEEEG